MADKMAMKCISILLIFVFASNLKAQDEFDKLYLLSEDVRSVVLKTPGGHPMPNHEFNLSTQQADQMQALASLDDLTKNHLEVNKTKPDCDRTGEKKLSQLKNRVDNREFTLSAVVFSSDKKYEQNALGRFMSDEYINYMGKLFLSGNTKALDIYNISALEASYLKDHPGVDLSKLSLLEKEKLLNGYAQTYLGVTLPPGLLMKEMTFQELINNSSNWQETLAQAKGVLSSQQKIELVSKLGGYFGNHYNWERFNQGDNATGFVDTQHLLDSLKNGTPGGVCRDVALAQAQMLKALGFNKSYEVQYKTLSGSHVNVITIDPETGNIIKFNYGETTQNRRGSGTEALTQDTSMPDHGLAFHIFDSDGKPVTIISSELGQMLKDSAGGDIGREFNQRNFSIAKVGFSSKYGDGNLFSGKTSSGEDLYGVALYKQVSPSEYLTVGAGASLSKLEGNRSLLHIDQQNFYARISAEVSSPKVNVGSVQAGVFAKANGDLLIYNSKETSLSSNRSVEANREIDGTADVSVGAQSTYTSANKRDKVDSKIYATFYPDLNHVASAEKVVAVRDSIIVKTGVTHDMTDETRAMIDTAVVLKNYGTSLVVKAVLEDDANKTRYTASVAAPLKKDMPTFLPGGERRASVGFEKTTEDDTTYVIEFERNIDNNSNSLMGKAQKKF